MVNVGGIQTYPSAFHPRATPPQRNEGEEARDVRTLAVRKLQ